MLTASINDNLHGPFPRDFRKLSTICTVYTLINILSLLFPHHPSFFFGSYIYIYDLYNSKRSTEDGIPSVKREIVITMIMIIIITIISHGEALIARSSTFTLVNLQTHSHFAFNLRVILVSLILLLNNPSRHGWLG